jgi:hypothetical protein
MYFVKKGKRRIISRYKQVDSGFRSVWNVWEEGEGKPKCTCNKEQDAVDITSSLNYISRTRGKIIELRRALASLVGETNEAKLREMWKFIEGNLAIEEEERDNLCLAIKVLLQTGEGND